MPASLEAGLPQFVLNDGYQVVFEARNPTTGVAVANVNVSEVTIQAAVDLTGDVGTADASGPFLYVPGPPNT